MTRPLSRTVGGGTQSAGRGADVASTNDRRGLWGRESRIVLDAIAVDGAHIGSTGIVRLRLRDVRVYRGRGIHAVEGERAVDRSDVERAGRRPSPSGDQ